MASRPKKKKIWKKQFASQKINLLKSLIKQEG